MPKAKKTNPIVIDKAKGLVFQTEEALYQHFIKEISFLEKEFFVLRNPEGDFKEEDFDSFEDHLGVLLEDPDEVWQDDKTIPGITLTTYLREFDSKKDAEDLFHVAVAYMTEDIPTFVYLHFPTNNLSLVEKYQRGELIYDRIMRDAPPGAIEGDALLEGDELAEGLYQSMLTVRGEKDIKEENFREFAHLREETIEGADEIWRNNDSMGNILVSFIKEHHDEEPEDLFYVVVTIEDQPSSSHALLFSFPTTDKSLVDRYRHGENLQADEVIQEASH